MEINHSTNQIRIGALKGIAFRQFRDGQLTAIDLLARLVQLKAQEEAR